MLCHEIEPHIESGAMSILGVFSRVLVDRFPITINPLTIAVRLSGTPREKGTCHVIVQDPFGGLLRSLPAERIELNVYGFMDFTVPLGPISLKLDGLHIAIISVDEVELRRVPIPVEMVRVM
jgi:hypothetical protein